MHTQHVKFSTYVAWGGGVVRAVAVVVVFEEGEASEMGASDDDVDGSVSKVVVAVVVVVYLSSLPSVPPLLLLRSIGTVLVQDLEYVFFSFSTLVALCRVFPKRKLLGRKEAGVN